MRSRDPVLDRRERRKQKRQKNFAEGRKVAWHPNLKSAHRCPGCGGLVQLPCRGCAVKLAKATAR